MKIVAFADVHDAFHKVAMVLQQTAPFDVVVVAGDITTAGTPADAERAIGLWRPLAPRLLAVAGNMDSSSIDGTLDDLGVSLNGRCQRVGTVVFFGCSAAPVSLGTPYEITELEIAARLEHGYEQARGATPLVLVPHAPPLGAVDTLRSGVHVGSPVIRRFIDRVQPALVLCGHIHESRGQQMVGSTLVVNCGAAARGHYAVVELTESECRASFY
jgi:uncharacterized protein